MILSQAEIQRVVKLGGSLLNWPDLRRAACDWLELQPGKTTGVIVGGGAVVDCLRRSEQVHGLAPVDMHWLCINSMSITAELAATIIRNWPRVDLAKVPTDLKSVGILNAWQLMQADREHSPQPLPQSWDVTSDSIAARACTLLQATELVLLKSALPPPVRNLAELAAADYVDKYFPQAARGIAVVRFVNLRSNKYPEVRFDTSV